MTGFVNDDDTSSDRGIGVACEARSADLDPEDGPFNVGRTKLLVHEVDNITTVGDHSVNP